jgi:hypothetical protein
LLRDFSYCNLFLGFRSISLSRVIIICS